MTWNGLCPFREAKLPQTKTVAHEGRNFTLTVNSRAAIYVNCAEETCNALIGTIEPEGVYHPAHLEPH